MMQFTSSGRTRPLTVGIVGAGTITTNVHLPVLSAFPSVKIGWVADSDPQRARMASLAFGVPMADSSAPARLPTCDIALLAIPLGPREDFLNVFAERGTAVLVEKPFAVTHQQHVRMSALFPPHALACGYMRRMYATTRLLRLAVEEKWFGQLQKVRLSEGARLTKTGVDSSYQDLASELGGGVLTNLGCHSLDAVLFITGGSSLSLKKGQVEWDGRTDRKVYALFEILELSGNPWDTCDFEFVVSWLDRQRNEIELEFDRVTLVSSLGVEAAVRLRSNHSGSVEVPFAPLGNWATTSNQAFFLEWQRFVRGFETGEVTELAARASLPVALAIDALLRGSA